MQRLNFINLYGLCFVLLFLSTSTHAKDKTHDSNGNIILVKAPPSSTPEDDFTEDEDEDEIKIYDPIENINRKIFIFNDGAYFYVLKPIAKGYRAAVPEQGRVAVSNFFSNLLAPVRIVNSALQLKGEDATNEVFRLIINSTIGLAGLFDVAKNDFKIKIKKEDFGQTLGHYQVGNGPYIVIPIIGPTTLRDGFGLLVDGAFLDPLNHIYDDESERYILARAVDIETTLSLDKDTYEAIKKDSLDPYLFLRNAYLQFRAGAVEN